MNLTTRTKYGTRFLLDIAVHAKNGPIPARESAEREGIPLKYLEKIIKRLNETGYVTGKRGPHGGNQLAKAPEDITIGEIALVLDGFEIVAADCEHLASCDRAVDCLKQTLWEKASRVMLQMLESYTLADLIRDAELCPLFGNHPLPHERATQLPQD